MRKILRIVPLALLGLLVTTNSAEAQYRYSNWFWGLTYQGALSAGDTKDFIDQFSFRNIGVEGRTMVNQNASVGMFFGWNVFNEKQIDGTVSLAGADASGAQLRYVNAFPMLLTGHYYFGERRGPRPYVGGGVGAYLMEHRLEIGTTALEAENWHFGFAPEFGVVFPTQGLAEGFLNVKYNYAVEAGGVTGSYWTFGVGLAARY